MTASPTTPELRSLHDRLGAMIDQVGHPDYSLRDLVVGLRAIRDALFTLSETEQTSPNGLWVVWYEDPAKQHEIFFGEGAEAAARARYKSAYDHWSCHLLRRVPHGK